MDEISPMECGESVWNGRTKYSNPIVAVADANESSEANGGNEANGGKNNFSYFNVLRDGSSSNKFDENRLFSHRPILNELDKPKPVTIASCIRAVEKTRKETTDKYDRGEICKDAYYFYMEQCDDEL